ncbi:Fur family transcriptional regulator [Alkalihalobacillus alcalophilus ATCC 27647 = CGMCC 1.3604]|uniref:Fur family transcriptional regulator n=1 Tax=Alkalihalobacillus alcalophilus ATCC 27647 = CGMCC 1.3604 TaxID=1218173 RepID=A0A094WIY3_ALKAL|nr:Fur family transcriptional regulator [Alkalihalobacillus alcalophilus]KGA95913.1 Fur family transcriptional regulator [Alkalihalobacillus alcalophilus ATCC 27647 = CGMCC 1.3604]MED1563708.1 Fur family transcriptional regulator [Alkalihalobacillus alcalophilus]THG89698.1 Fur family transcriptional regulator [Alkalihalobacillus alcalophilus ATCC 27647 = CGMCC 1.3604]
MDINEAMNRLKEKGYKHTGKREEMLRLFSDEKRYISAKDVLEAMNDYYPGLSFDTIYRNLSLFTDLDILETTELEGEKRFRFRCSTQHHHHHLICLDCGKTAHIQNCPMDGLQLQAQAPFSDFEVTGHKFEIYGKCGQCQQ